MKNKSQLNEPKLRFKGFQADWKWEQISSVLNYEQPSKYLVESENYSNNTNLLPVLTAGKSYILGYTNKTGNAYKKGKVIIFDDFTMDMRFIDFDFKIKSSAIKLLTSPHHDLRFVFMSLQKLKLHPIGHNRHYISIVQNEYLCLPSSAEQIRISKFFSLLDKRIELWERKLQLNELTKLFFLKNLFINSENHSGLSRLRFKGFKTQWHIKKLGDLLEISTGNKDLKNKVENGKYPFYVRSEKIERIDEFIHDCEAILLPGDGKVGEIFHYINGKFNFHQRVYALIKSSENLKYIYYEFQVHLKKHLLSFSAKATVDSIRLPMLQDYTLFVPDISEQEKIVQFFALLDTQIELNKKVILNNINKKWWFLSKMFI